jgi:hypothetical protein
MTIDANAPGPPAEVPQALGTVEVGETEVVAGQHLARLFEQLAERAPGVLRVDHILSHVRSMARVVPLPRPRSIGHTSDRTRGCAMTIDANAPGPPAEEPWRPGSVMHAPW